MRLAAAVAWWNPDQRDAFLAAWGVERAPEWLFLQQDATREGGAKTKNKAMRRAVAAGAEVVVCLDDDCFPEGSETLEEFCEQHLRALEPQPVQMFEVVTDPPSRGTPYDDLAVVMPVAASMGFWTHVGDYCAPRQLSFGARRPMSFNRRAVHGRYFPLCAMNYAFRPAEWDPWHYLVEDVGRFDDIWMGWMWQREAYRRGHCFNLAGPMVRHSRQSNVWRNLKDEARYLEQNETLWREIATHPRGDYASLCALLPHARESELAEP